MNQQYHYAVGRRKTGNARAKYYQSSDSLTVSVNSRNLQEYFGVYFSQKVTEAISKLAINSGKIDFFVRGSGLSSQADACKLAIAKALVKADPGTKVIARMYGYLTSDNRKVLPKKAGLRKARKSEQWSKR